jgi:16S rRNA (cytidine1402-2'-O)-methyltransferase
MRRPKARGKAGRVPRERRPEPAPPADPSPASGISPGILYVVATPIGNLADITLRALTVLRDVDRIAAEDTRTTRGLLTRHGIEHATLEPFHAHNEATMARRLAGHLAAGRSLALVTDAGTPGVSDPAFLLVREALAVGAQVIPIPGPSAVLAGLAGSGLSMARFLFEGFPPRRSGPRRRMLESLVDLPHTLVFFEAPPRLASFLADVEAVLGDRKLAIGRELTKLHETFWRGTVSGYLAAQLPPPRGEVTVLVAGAARSRAESSSRDGETGESEDESMDDERVDEG